MKGLRVLQQLLESLIKFEFSEHLNHTFQDYQFKELYGYHKSVQKISKRLLDLNTAYLTQPQLDELLSSVDKLSSVYKDIGQFTITNQDNYTNLINHFIAFYNEYVKTSSQFFLLGFINEDLKEFSMASLKKTEDIRLEASQQLKDIKIVREEISESNKRISEILASVKNYANDIAVSQYSGIFKQEAGTYKEASKTWFTGIIVLLALTVIATLLTLIFEPDIEKYVQPINYIAGRIIILSMLLIGISICMRNYKAAKHNEIVNRQKQNALDSFEIFVNTSKSDDSVKNAILLEATHTIFSHQSTGYDSGDKDGDNPNKIVEIIKNVTTTKN